MYLDLANLQDFMKEVSRRKCKEVRITPIFRTQGVVVTGSVVFTAPKNETIIRFEEIIGRAASYDEAKVKELETSVNEYVTEVRKQAAKKKLTLRSGIYKFPSELGG